MGSSSMAQVPQPDEGVSERLSLALLSGDPSLDGELDSTARAVADTVGDACVVALIDDSGRYLVPRAFHHRTPDGEEALRDVLSGSVVSVGVGLAGSVAETGRPIVKNDIPVDQVLAAVAPQHRVYVEKFPTTSMLIVALTSGGKVIGTLGVSGGTPYSDEDKQLLEVLAARVGATVDAGQLRGELADSYALLRAIADSLPALVGHWDRELINNFANDAYTDPFGLTPEEISGKHIRDVIGPKLYQQNKGFMQAALRGERQDFDRTFIDADGRTHHWQATYIPDQARNGRIGGFSVLVTDVTEKVEATRALAESEETFRVAFEDAPIGMALVGLDGRFLRVNSVLCDILHRTPDDLRQLTFQDITHPDDLDSDLDQVERLLAGEIPNYQIEKRYSTPDGRLVWVNLAGSLVRSSDGRPLHFVAQIEDISARKEHEDEMVRLAEQDGLTGVLNRRRFDDELARQQALVARHGGRVSLAVLDVDGLKAINDELGHPSGDALLTQIAAMVAERVRRTDVFARIGGDEFALILPNTGLQQALAVAGELVDRVSRGCDGTVSVGVATIDPEAPDKTLKRADEAMYEAKKQGGNRAAGFTPDR